MTHALRTTEYLDRDQQYYWVLDALGKTRIPFTLVTGKPGPEIIRLEFILKLKIKHNDWLRADTCCILSLRLFSSFITSGPDYLGV